MGFYIYSYFKVGTSNPGIASSTFDLEESQHTSIRYCKPCKILRPLGTVHCYSCDVCIYNYDHHCPWIGKCVGRDNMCDFKIFLFSIVVAIGTFAACVYIKDKAPKGIPNE
jgi:palmitoyltransferase ZDHHC9/14/18/palmitoyltransferase